MVGMSSHFSEPYTEEYNLNTQFQFARDYLLEVGYVGTRSVHVAGCSEFNQALLASPTAPVYGQTYNSVINVVQRAPYQGVAPGSYSCTSTYNSNYNSLQSSVTKRLSHGLQFLGSYTYSRNLDETSGSSGSEVFELWLLTNDQRNPRGDYGLTDFDRTHRGVLSLTYTTPAFATMPSLVRHSIAGWQASGIFVAQSGTPITILDDNAGAVYGNYPFENRAQLSGMPTTTSGSLHSRVLSSYLNANGFTSAPEAPNGLSAADTDFGNSGVGLVRGPRTAQPRYGDRAHDSYRRVAEPPLPYRVLQRNQHAELRQPEQHLQLRCILWHRHGNIEQSAHHSIRAEISILIGPTIERDPLPMESTLPALAVQNFNILTVEEIKAAYARSEAIPYPDPMLARAELPLQQTFYPLGFPLQVLTNCEEVLDIADECWHGFSQLFDIAPIRFHIGVTAGGSGECPPGPFSRVREHLCSHVADRENFAVSDASSAFTLLCG